MYVYVYIYIYAEWNYIDIHEYTSKYYFHIKNYVSICYRPYNGSEIPQSVFWLVVPHYGHEGRNLLY